MCMGTRARHDWDQDGFTRGYSGGLESHTSECRRCGAIREVSWDLNLRHDVRGSWTNPIETIKRPLRKVGNTCVHDWEEDDYRFGYDSGCESHTSVWRLCGAIRKVRWNFNLPDGSRGSGTNPSETIEMPQESDDEQ